MKFLFPMVIVCCWSVAACAVNTLEQEFTCPIDGAQWKQRVESSSNPRGLRLDLRQLGDVVDPPTLPQCPKCRFPLFSDQLAEAVIDRLKPFVLGADFQMVASKNPSYFNLAQVQEFLKAPDRYVALSYLRASWQVEDREAVCRRFIEKAHAHFEKALAGMKPGDRQFTDAALLCGEVERRLGKWEEAGKRFRDLGAHPGSMDARMTAITARQLQLIEARDASPQSIEAPGAAPDGSPANGFHPKPGAPEPVTGQAHPKPNLSRPAN